MNNSSKKGQWRKIAKLRSRNLRSHYEWLQCSVCKELQVGVLYCIKTNFCPHCGADLREEEGK